MDRFKSPCIETNANHLKVMFYNDLNPKRARMVNHPKDYKWSSFHYYAYGKRDPLITSAPCYVELGETTKERQKNYLMMVEQILKNDWKDKKPYSSTPFIGNPEWVTQKYNELKRANSQKRKDWKEEFKKKFQTKMAQNE